MKVEYFNNVKQQSVEWFEMRLGMLTGSKLATIIDANTGELKSDLNKNGTYKTKTPIISAISGIIAEIKTGFSNDSDFVNDAMEWGIETEPERIGLIKNENSFQTGFVLNSRFKYFGLSPDLLENCDGITIKGTEIKCPTSKTFVEWVIKNEVPSKHKPQIMAYFVAIPTLETMVFDVYDPRFLGEKKSHSIEIKRADNTKFIDNMELALINFEKQIETYLKLFN